MTDDTDSWVGLLVGGMALMVSGLSLSRFPSVGRLVPYALFTLAIVLSVAAVAKANSET